MMNNIRCTVVLLLFCCGLGAWADNNITLSSVEGAAGTEVTVSVSMTNTDAVSALQLSIPLNENLTFVQNSQQSGSRLSGHSFSAGVKDGVLNLMVYSATMAAFGGNEGDVCSFKLQLGTNPGTINLTSSKTALTSTEGQALGVSVSAGSVKILGAKVQLGSTTLGFGKVGVNQSSRQSVMVKNVGNETLTISEISFTSEAFSTTTSLPLDINAGSTQWIYVNCMPTSVDALDEEMAIVSNNVTGNSLVRLTATPFGVNELRLGNASGSTDEEVTVPVSMNNYNDITGLQMEIQIPNGLEYVSGSFEMTDRKQDHVVSAIETDDVLTVVAYSPTDQSFTGSEGEIGSFKVKIVGSNNCNLNFKKAAMSSSINDQTVNVLSGSYGCTVSVKSPSLSANSSLDFGKISINEQNMQKTYTIRNYGSAPLIISKINFTNGLFHIQEELPLTIETSSSKTITVVCEAKEEGDIGTNMEIYTNDSNRRLFIAKITGEIFTPDYLTPIVEGKPDEVNLAISLNNYSDIYGIQFDIVTAKDFTASANDVTLTERGNNLSVSINSIAQGRLRVVAYAKNNQFISSGEGKVMTIKLVPKESLTTDAYTMTLSNITLGSKGMKNIYAGKDVTITFGIGAPVTVTAKSYTRKYGEANPTFEYDVEGAELDGQPVITCEARATSPVGEYPIVIKKGNVKNYNDTYVNGVLTIEKAPLTITAKSYTIKLSEALPTFEAQYSGFKNYETKNVLTRQPTITCETTSTSTPGTYDIVVSGAEAQNYVLSYEKGTLTIIADPVTVTANSYTIAYGDAIPELGYTSSGAELSGTPDISCEATSTSPVGTYPIVISKGSVTNYNDSYVNGVLTITKAPLTINVDNYEKKQYDSMPEIVVTYKGFKNNETEEVLTKQPVVSCEANEDSAPGEYAITVGGAEASNYEIQYVTGKLIVTEPDSYTLTYIVDGEVYKSFSVKYRDTITPLDAPTKEGYTFSGWSEIPATMPAKDVVISGSFTINSYTLTYIVDGEVYKTSSVVYGTSMIPETAPTKEGFTFSGWSEIPSTMPAKDVVVTGSFTINSYTLTYKVDGEVYRTSTVAYGTALTPETAPTKEGYTFSGWSEIPATMPAHDVVVTGGFSVNSYTLTYKVDGEVYMTSTIAYGTILTLEAVPEKEGYTFSGWSEIPKTMPAKDVTITGSFTVNSYTLTYKVDGEVYRTSTVAYGTALTPETAPTKEGHTFSGWSEIPATMPAHDVVVTGSFIINKYKLTYMVDGVEYKFYEINYASTITPEAEPTKEGYTFSGWSEIPETMPAHDVVVTGTFSKGQYVLTYIVDGQTYKSIRMDYGNPIVPEDEPSRDGYTFSGWSKIPETMPAHDVVVTGTFSVNSYTLTYKVDGEVYKTSTVTYDTTLTPEPAPTKEGYTFSGWSEIPVTMPAHDVVVTGSFIINKYKLTYMVDGVEYKSYEINYASTITPEAEPTKEGYTFSGWSEIPATMPAHDVVVAGSFIINKYKLTYMVDGVEYKFYEINYASTITPEAEPTKEGYTFSGWSEIPSTMPAKDVVVTGSFIINKYKLTYMVDGVEYKSYEINYASTITPEAEPTKEGYTFSGWSEIPATMPAHDVVVTGIFSVNSYTLTYKVDGEEYQSFTVKYRDPITPLDAPEKEGYTFSGWDGLPRSMPAQDVVVKGYFTINSYTITYVLDGEVYATETLEYGAEIVPPAIPGLEDYTIWKDVPETMPANDITIYGKAREIIDSLTPALSKGEGEVYDLSGRKNTNGLKRGINIIRKKDGTSRKVLVK